MVNINKILTLSFLWVFLLSTNTFAATNKETLISNITTLETKINTTKTSNISNLEDVVTTLSTNFDTAVTDLWYTSQDVEYLVSLWKISTNFKTDLITEQASIKSDLNTAISNELSTLDALKDNINYNYTTVSDSQKVSFDSQISTIDDNIDNISETYTSKIDKLKTKYTSSLTTYKSNLKSAFEWNKTNISTIASFDDSFQDLYSLVLTFQSNYDTFKIAYLSYAWELEAFSTTKQEYYINALKTELNNLKTKNIEANSNLKTYESDIDRLIDLLLENFSNSLKLDINESYWVLFSDTSDVDSILNSFTNLKNKYYDTDWLIKWTLVVSNSWTTDEIKSLKTKLTTINNSLKNLIWDDSSSTITISNVKVRLENQMVKFYNANYDDYRQDLLTKIKEKLDVNTLEAKSVIIAADSIDLRYSLLSDKINKSNDLSYINTQIADFKDSVNIYSYLNSQTLNKKIKKINNNLDIFVINKETALAKYKSYTNIWAAYETQVSAILNKLEAKYPDTYNEKLDTLVTRIDTVLWKYVSAKSRYTLLVIKKTIVTWQNNKIN